MTQHAVVRSDACAATACHGSAGTSLTTIHSSCAMCHDSYAPARAKAAIVAGNKDCANCHGFADHKALHAVTRNDTCAASQCHGAADTSLMTIHSSCAVCHGATASDATKAAIAAGNKDCANCHGFTDHTGLHAVVRNDSCAACHVPADTNLITIHKGACATCHASGKDAVKEVIAAGRSACRECHGVHDFESVHAASPASQTITIRGVDYGERGCSQCHSSLDLRTLHANNCSACHTTSVDTTLGGTWNKSCAQGGCHAAGSTKPFHGTLDFSHTVTAWPAGFSGCSTGSCHTGGTDVAAIHASKLGCATCHGGDKVPTLACGSVGCHEKTHDLPAAHAASPASETITINSVDYGEHGCSECHSPLDLRNVHSGDDSCNTCHTASVKTTLGGTWNKSCVQGGCHTAGSTKPFHGTVDSSHTVSASVLGEKYKDCTTGTCHSGGYDVAKIHGVAGGPGCSACHGGTKVPTLDCGTVGCHDKTHDLPAAHAASPASQTITINSVDYGEHGCSECHSPLDLRNLHANNCDACHATSVKTKLGGAWDKSCVQGGCHTSGSTRPMHATLDTSHTVLVSALPEQFKDCTTGTCHTGGYDVAKIHAPKLGCATCHGGDKVPTLDCGRGGCHDKTHDLPAAHAASPASQTITINTLDYGKHECSDCHTPLDLRNLHANKCDACHTTSVKTTLGGVAWDKSCVQGGCHSLTSKKPMHSTLDTSHTVPVSAIADKYKDCTTGTCHSGGYDVAKIHGVDGGPGCSACHGGTKVPTLDCGASACHASLNHTAKHDVPARTDECVGCHAGTNLTAIKLSTGAVSAKHANCATCHAPAASSKVPTATLAAAIAGGHKECSFCHADLDHIAKHDVVVPVRTDACVDCHAGTNLTLVHDPARVSCLTCHRSTDPNVVLAISTHNKACGACHADAHQALHQWCNDCHSNLDSITWGEHGANPMPDQPCANCHGKPFQPLSGIGASHSGCENPTCHDGEELGSPSAELHTVARPDTCASCHPGTNLTLIKLSTGAVSTKHANCATCHAPAASSKVPTATIAAAIAGGHKECSACHGTGHDLPALHAASPASQTITINTVDYGKHECSDCHTPLDLRTLHGVGDASCAKCHTTSVKTTLGGVAWNKSCVQGGCHTVASGNMKPQHYNLTAAHATPASAQTNCGGATCHGATLPADVAALHAPYGGCADCHGGSKSPSLICSSCHAAHATQAVLHAATLTSANFTFNGTNFGTIACSTCHASTDLTVVHTSAGACTACHPGIKTALGGTWTWNKTCTQGTCHNVTAPHPYHATVGNHVVAASGCNATGCHPTNVAYAHSRVGCGVCHAPGHKPLTTTCASCHGAGGTATRVDSATSHMPAHDYCNYCHLVSPAYDEHGGNPGRPIDASWTCANCHGTAGVSPRLVGLYDHGC